MVKIKEKYKNRSAEVMTNTNRTNFQSGLVWEPLRGYSRAVEIGDTLYISGTTAVNEKGEVIGVDNPYLQTQYVLKIIKNILRSANYKLDDVVRTRLFVTDISKWDEYARAHREVFEEVRPASAIVEVKRLMDPRLLIEMEVEAVKARGKLATQNITCYDK